MKKEKRENLSEELNKIDIDAALRGMEMIQTGSDEVDGVNHSFTRKADIEMAERNAELRARSRAIALQMGEIDD